MFWYSSSNKIKQILTALSLGVVSIFTSCVSNDLSDNTLGDVYFDIPSYFGNQIDSLTQKNPLITKTVFDNNHSEEKNVRITNWDIELASFTEVDLNKPAYKGYIQQDSIGNKVKFTFTNSDIDLKHVQIEYKNNELYTIEIDKKTKNYLYETDEKLIYIKDSLYTIEKQQKVILMSPNDYKISGLFQ